MRVICVLLGILPLIAAKVLPRTGVNDVLDGIAGVMYDVPEYEDPEVSLFKLLSRGIMPVYTVRNGAKDSAIMKNERYYYQVDDIKKGLDDVVAQLQEAKNKLENGDNQIYKDIDKSVLFLESLKHRLYLDLHALDSSRERSSTSDIPAEQSPDDKTPIDKYPILKTSIKKYLLSDDSAFKYILDSATEKPSTADDSADLYLVSDTVPVPYITPNASVEEPVIYDVYPEQSFESDSSNDQNTFSDAYEQSLASPYPINKPLLLGKKAIFKYQVLTTVKPFDENSGDEKEAKTSISDDVSTDGIEELNSGDKTIIQKKWTWKVSSLI